MGQPVHIMVFAADEAQGLAACTAALAELRRVESRLSLFDDASDLCELNRQAGGAWMTLDRDLAAILRQAMVFRRLTSGAFDAAIEPLMRAWGFHRASASAPSAAEIAEARDAVAHAEVRLEASRARLPNAHTQLDFGGIGVGYGIDRALAVLRSQGICRAFVDVSGDCGAIGAPPGEAGWRVDITDPRVEGHMLTTVRLKDQALATSANTAAELHYGALTIGHVLDPATGRPANALLQASVVARHATAADAFSTAMLVSGKRLPSPHIAEAYTIPLSS
jgi:thiamine biosynthesis lipoprotein